MFKKVVFLMILTSGFLFAWFGETLFGETFADISGEAFLKTKGGSVRTCAGNTVYLEKFDTNGILYLTDTLETKNSILQGYQLVLKQEKYLDGYDSEIIQAKKYNLDTTALQKSIDVIKRGLPVAKKRLPVVRKEIEEIKKKIKTTSMDAVKETTCNSQGKFLFSGLKPDKYYLKTTVQWFVGSEKQGGTVNKTIILKEGKNEIIINK